MSENEPSSYADYWITATCLMKVGDYVETKTFNGELISGKVISIFGLKEALWASIKTIKGVRTIKLN